MNDFTMRLVHLHHCRGIGWNTIFQLLKADPELTSLYYLKMNDLNLPKTSAIEAYNDLHSKQIYDQIQQYLINGIQMITIFDDRYPQLLKETYQPPWVLYAKGDLAILNEKIHLAVVGTRQYTEYGENAIKYLFPKLIENNIVIVSGLATGIDTIAHEVAMMNKGKTIGVIAGGFHYIYPQANKRLAEEMMNNHLLLSEYPPNTKPQKWQFPMRNRIISGISKGTLVIQAKRKSGSLITANFAVQEGREVFALPGTIFSEHSKGTNELIQQGAKLVNSPEDIMEELIYFT
ncbi:DNA processing protein [Cytobacillus eiseniae]|uniref:DNA processing protein n=1 Tax=Cytobacillus eiseniae TaxID=762947 RepID=A0ABS4RB40_9BACI|nr:DNA-processing protein DprA [Cytobacillus eiseniae]MBP2240114.1 DNA processing protein [Cytobacillus eiseniae]